MSERTYSGFPGFPGPKPDARLASEDAREQGASAPCGTCGATPETGISEGCLECEGFAPPALPSPSGPDAETLAATVLAGIDANRASGRSEARAALSGLVALVEQLTEQSTERLWRLNNAEALVEQRERERDDQRTRRYELAADATRKCTEFRERAEKAEALLARHRQALEPFAKLGELLAHDRPNDNVYGIHDGERGAARVIVRDFLNAAALSASAPGTEEPA